MSLAGERLGPYRLLRLLGSGGMGEVYLAEDARIGQQVAIKVIRSEGIAYPESESARDAARLFEREAKAIARLDHPNILPLYAYGEETFNVPCPDSRQRPRRDHCWTRRQPLVYRGQ